MLLSMPFRALSIAFRVVKFMGDLNASAETVFMILKFVRIRNEAGGCLRGIIERKINFCHFHVKVSKTFG